MTAVWLLALVLAAQETPALPDFSTSNARIDPAVPVAGDVIRYEITVTNTGADARSTRIASTLPNAFLLDLAGACADASVDPSTRQFEWRSGSFAKGESLSCVARLLTRRDAAGTMASIDTAVTAFLPDAYRQFSAEVELASRADPHRVAVGSYFISRAGAVMLAHLGVLILGYVVLRMVMNGAEGPARRDALRAWTGCIVGAGFLSIFGSMAIEDYRAATLFTPAQCLVMGGGTTAASVRGSRGGPETPVFGSSFVVRYNANGTETFSSGFGSASRLSFGSRAPSQQIAEKFLAGSTHPCWYDPDDVKVVLLDRRPGGAYAFALLPLGGALVALAALAGAVRGR